MKIGIISDTHDQVEKIKKAIKIFNKEKVVLVYHLGDWCSPFTLELYRGLRCSVKGIFGNNDADIYKMFRYKPDNVEFFDKFYVDEFDGKKICLFHGDPKEIVERLFDSKQYDLLLSGHDHISKIRDNGKTLHIDPGSMMGRFSGAAKSWTEPSIVLYDFKKARLIKL
ncbi:MAG: YfcE family phosphodiesterase [Candidatus Woesearchaeota archaeon]|nr:YfcE family phosphodiesterase [Candidatus Woesearchaeota archaeon]